MKPKIKYWTTIEEAEKIHYKEALFPYESPRCFYQDEAEFDIFHEDALIQELVYNRYIICGDTHQNRCIPVFNDGYVLLSMRKWQEIMEIAYKICNPYETEVPNFYMATCCNVDENLPKIKK